MHLAFLTFAAAGASVASAQDYPTCDNSKLIAVVAGSTSVACTAASTYSPVSGSLPTAAQYQVLCLDSTCSAFLDELKASNPSECVITGVFSDDRLLYASLITPIETECDALPGTAVPPTETETPTKNQTTTVTPAPTPDATPDSTPAPTPDTTVDPTPAPTPDATSAPAPDATPDSSPAPTPDTTSTSPATPRPAC